MRFNDLDRPLSTCKQNVPDGSICLSPFYVGGICVRAADHASPTRTLPARLLAWVWRCTKPTPVAVQAGSSMRAFW